MTDIALPQNVDWFKDVPRSIRGLTLAGLLLFAAAFGGFGYWAFKAPLAAAVIAQGSFVATGQNKKIQHFEGGIIQEILVAEGDNVEAGQPLLRLDETAALANERQLLLRQVRLEAISARLQAESAAASDIDFSRQLMAQRSDLEIAKMLDSQVTNFHSSRQKLQSDTQLLLSNIESLDFRAQGYEKQRKAMARQLEFLELEFEAKNELFKQGLIRRTEVNAIQRAMADAEGQVGRLAAEVSETRSQIKKHKDQIRQTQAVYRQAALDELQTVQAELETVREQSRNARSVLRRATIHAPVAGTIIRLHYNTAGGVVESGKTIAEILPTGVPLIIESQISRSDIDTVRPGQKTVVRLTALNQRTTPVLNGEVFYVSADSIAETHDGLRSEVYLARVSLPVSELQRVHGFSPTPGMPAEVMIQTAERTFFNYITKPIVDSMNRAFRER